MADHSASCRWSASSRRWKKRRRARDSKRRAESCAARHATPSQGFFSAAFSSISSRDEFFLGAQRRSRYVAFREFFRSPEPGSQQAQQARRVPEAVSSRQGLAVGGENNDVWRNAWWTFASPRQLGRKWSSRRPSSLTKARLML